MFFLDDLHPQLSKNKLTVLVGVVFSFALAHRFVESFRTYFSLR